MTKNPFEEIYLKNFDIPEGRTIYLSRHGESQYNEEDRIGGDSSLTDRGQQYAQALGLHMNTSGFSDLKVWTSSLVRTKQTAAWVSAPKHSFSELDEINAGDFDGYTYEEISQMFPEEFQARAKDKLSYKYPKGESYIDCCNRILPILERIESNDGHLLVVAHQAILRCMATYFLKGDLTNLPHVKIPQHCLIKVTYLNGENIIDFIRTPINHSEQGIIKSILIDAEDSPMMIKSAY